MADLNDMEQGASNGERHQAAPSAFADREQAFREASAAPRSGVPSPRAKVVAACVAVLCVGLIGVSGFALAGGFDQPGGGVATAEQAKQGDARQDLSAKDEGGSAVEEDAAGVASEGVNQGPAGDVSNGAESTDVKSSGGNGTASGSPDGSTQGNAGSEEGSSNGAVSGSSSSGSANKPAASEPKTVTVTISADGSAGGGSASGPVALTFEKGATVYDAVQGAGWVVAASSGPMGVYVESINGVAEDAGHGWTYYVNGAFPGYSCAYYELSDGDVIEWKYVAVS